MNDQRSFRVKLHNHMTFLGTKWFCWGDISGSSLRRHWEMIFVTIL